MPILITRKQSAAPRSRRARLNRLAGALVVVGTISTSPAIALIDATLDDAHHYQAVVILVAGAARRCTATKIAARRFLTAAHCVADSSSGAIDRTFAPGSAIHLSNVLAPAGPADFQRLHVERTHLPPEYEQALKRLFTYQQNLIRRYRKTYSGAELEQRIRHVRSQNHFTARVADIAIVKVHERTPVIPAARIDFSPLIANDPVHLVGYGCERPGRENGRGEAPSRGRRKWGESRVIRVDPVNFYTFAHRMRQGAPSLCPGDSGGPVMRAGKVVGVHGTVYGLADQHGARSNMSVNLRTVQPWLKTHSGPVTPKP